MRTRPATWTTRTTSLLAVAVATAALTAFPAAVASAEGEGEITWSVQPSSPTGPDGRTAFDYQAAPGSVISDYVSITNFSTTATTFRAYAADAVTDYETGAFTLVGSERVSEDLGAWVSVDSAPTTCDDTATGTAGAADGADAAEAACAAGLGIEITLEPNTRADIPFTITVPQNATPGDHAAGIVASYQRVGDGTENVNVAQRVGTRIYLRVDGALTPELSIAGLVSGYDSGWNPFGAGVGTVGFDLANSGNTRLTGTPSVTLTGPFDIPFGTVPVEPVRNLLPGQSAHVVAEFPGIPPLLLLFADVSVAPAPTDGAAAADALPAAVTASTLAWAVPWSLLVLLVIVAALIVGVVWYRRRSRERLAVALDEFAAQVHEEAIASTRSDGERDPRPFPSAQTPTDRTPTEHAAAAHDANARITETQR